MLCIYEIHIQRRMQTVLGIRNQKAKKMSDKSERKKSDKVVETSKSERKKSDKVVETSKSFQNQDTYNISDKVKILPRKASEISCLDPDRKPSAESCCDPPTREPDYFRKEEITIESQSRPSGYSSKTKLSRSYSTSSTVLRRRNNVELDSIFADAGISLEEFRATSEARRQINVHNFQFEGYQWSQKPPNCSYVGDGDVDGDKIHDLSLFLDDGASRIDFVLVYKVATGYDQQKHIRWRHTFEDNLRKEGIVVETCTGRGHNTDYRFVKLHCSWKTLTRWAEILALNVPMSIDKKSEEHSRKAPARKYICHHDKEALPELPKFNCSAFCKDRENQFLVVDKRIFFSPAERNLIADSVLSRTIFDHTGRSNGDLLHNRFGIEDLLSEGAYLDAFPLHSGDADAESVNCVDNLRYLLATHWGCWSQMFKTQPLEHIRLYFGTQIAFYFAWLGFYTYMLLPAAIVGLLVFIVSLLAALGDDELCDAWEKEKNTVMCPKCDTHCPYWHIPAYQCISVKVKHVFDNGLTIAFAVFMSMWSCMFIELWVRKRNTLKCTWSVRHFNEHEKMRPKYQALQAKRVPNPVTGEPEPYIPTVTRILRTSTSIITIVTMLGMVVVSLITVTIFSTISSVLAMGVGIFQEYLIPMIGGIVNVIVIIIFGEIYHKMAVRLTEYEMPRTQSEFEDRFITKLFLFQFVNHHASIFYIAFFKGKLVGRPGAYNRTGGYRNEECYEDCFTYVAIQLAILIVSKQVFQNFQEIHFPKIVSYIKRKLHWDHLKGFVLEDYSDAPRWEKDYTLDAFYDLGLIDEYMEMVLQYSFVTVFVAAFPLAPLLALLNNLFEIRIDARKFTSELKRPVARRAEDIGAWFDIIKIVSVLSVITNAALIAFTSEFASRYVWRNEYDTPAGNHGNVSQLTFVRFSLSSFNVVDFEEESVPEDPGDGFENVSTCAYFDYREPQHPYAYTIVYWKRLAVQFIFVVVFVLVIGSINSLVHFLVPDIPKKAKIAMLKEIYITEKAVEEHLYDEDEEDNSSSKSTAV